MTKGPDNDIILLSEGIAFWKQLFPDGSLREDVEAPIKAVIACRGIPTKVETPLYDAILENLDNISKTSDPITRVLAVKDLWRTTGQFVTENVPALEAYTSLLQAACSSAIRENRDVAELRRHQASLRRVRKFFIAYPGITGEPVGEPPEWESMWKRISGTLPIGTGTITPNPDGQGINTGRSLNLDLASIESHGQVGLTPPIVSCSAQPTSSDPIGTSLAEAQNSKANNLACNLRSRLGTLEGARPKCRREEADQANNNNLYSVPQF